MRVTYQHIGYLVLYISTGSAHSLLVKYSQRADKTYAYEPVLITFSVTCFKLFFTLFYIFCLQPSTSTTSSSTAATITTSSHVSLHHNAFTLLRTGSRVAKWFMVPAALYFIFDLLAFVNLKLVQPATFRLLINVKVLFSGLLLSVIVGQKLRARQWAALFLLLLACVVEQSDSFDPHTGLTAITLICTQALCSSAAGVYFQYLLQSSQSSHEHSQLGLWEKNAFMYTWTLMFNFLYALVMAPHIFFNPLPAFQTLDTRAIPIILTSGIGGFSTSLILRDMDVIAKEYANFAEMCVVVIGSSLMLGSPLHLTLVVAVLLVTFSLYLYNVAPVAEKSVAAPLSLSVTDMRTPVVMQRKSSSAPKMRDERDTTETDEDETVPLIVQSHMSNGQSEANTG